MRIARHQVRDESIGLDRRQFLSVERSRRRVVEPRCLHCRYTVILMVEKQVLAIECDPQILVVLIAHACDEAHKVQRIVHYVVVGPEPLKHAESRQLRLRNEEVAEDVPTDISLSPILQDRLPYRRLRTKRADGVVARRGRSATITKVRARRERLARCRTKRIERPASREQIPQVEGVLAVVELAREVPCLGGIMKQCRDTLEMRVAGLQRSRKFNTVRRGVAPTVVEEAGHSEAVISPVRTERINSPACHDLLGVGLLLRPEAAVVIRAEAILRKSRLAVL